MSTEVKQAVKWQVPSAVFVSDSGNLLMHIRELIKQLNWRMQDENCSPINALSSLESGTASLFIVEDSPKFSAYEAVRIITSHPVGRLSPIFVLIQDIGVKDIPIFQKILHTSVVKKPLTPSLFGPAFKQCLDTWQSPLFVALRRCGSGILNNDLEAVIPVLSKLSEIPSSAPFAVGALVQLYIQKEDWKEAEAVVINAVKVHPRLPSLIHTVAAFYTQAKMPAQAMRFYKKLKGICGGTPLFSFDIAQAAIAIGHLDIAIETLTEWSKARPGNELVTQFLARLYLSEGLEAELERILHMNRSSAKKLLDQWEKAETPGLTPLVAS
jgi:tetratricopeptide (TPR) repeat protein